MYGQGTHAQQGLIGAGLRALQGHAALTTLSPGGHILRLGKAKTPSDFRGLWVGPLAH